MHKLQYPNCFYKYVNELVETELLELVKTHPKTLHLTPTGLNRLKNIKTLLKLKEAQQQ